MQDCLCTRTRNLARNARMASLALTRRNGSDCVGKATCKPVASQVLGRCLGILFVFSSYSPLVLPQGCPLDPVAASLVPRCLQRAHVLV
jgi:hypothetical protein